MLNHYDGYFFPIHYVCGLSNNIDELKYLFNNNVNPYVYDWSEASILTHVLSREPSSTKVEFAEFILGQIDAGIIDVAQFKYPVADEIAKLRALTN